MSRRCQLGVYVGRFQPLHNAHLAVMREALSRAETLVIVLGSAGAARSAKNPFTDAERAAMILGALPEYAGRVRIATVPDVYNLAKWAREVRRAVEKVAGGVQDVALFGHDKDASSAYLQAFEGWPFVPTRVRSELGATSVRRALFEGDFETVEASVPPNVEGFLREFVHTPEFAALQREDAFLREWRAAWGKVAEVPTFASSHGLITSGDLVLLTRRTELPGQGLLMLPGGELHPKLSLAASLRRHVLEQAGLALPSTGAGPAEVFDHPDRSPLGREVAHVFSAEIGEREGNGWRPIEDALSRPAEFCADHFHILQTMLAARRA